MVIVVPITSRPWCRLHQVVRWRKRGHDVLLHFYDELSCDGRMSYVRADGLPEGFEVSSHSCSGPRAVLFRGRCHHDHWVVVCCQISSRGTGLAGLVWKLQRRALGDGYLPPTLRGNTWHVHSSVYESPDLLRPTDTKG